jgi:non-heme chloroperoxidase
MQNKYLGRTGEFVELANGLNVHYQESGKGDKPLLFVPGWTMTTDVFCRQLAFFEASTDYRFITVDPRSHGKTDVTQNDNHYEQQGRDLHEFISALALDDIVVCGWSFATLATLAYANQFGCDKLGGFIMLDGPPRASGSDLSQQWATYSYDDADGFDEFFTMGKLRDPDKTNVEFARWMLEDKNPHAIDWIKSMTRCTPNEIAALLNATAKFLDYTDDLICIGDKIPVWCVVREQQRKIIFDWCSKHLPSAQLSAFGEHMMFWERADQFNTELLAFLETTQGA